MNAIRYRRNISLTVGALVAFMTAFPYLLLGFVQASSCAGVTGACGAMAAIGGIYLKSFVLIVILATLMGLVFFRCAALDMSRWWLLAFWGWVADSWSYLFAAGNFWGANFGVGILRVSPPILLLACTVFLAFLCADTTPWERRERAGGRAGWTIAALAGAHASLKPLISQLVFVILLLLPGSQATWNVVIFLDLCATKLLNFGLSWSDARWVDVAVLTTIFLRVLIIRN